MRRLEGRVRRVEGSDEVPLDGFLREYNNITCFFNCILVGVKDGRQINRDFLGEVGGDLDKKIMNPDFQHVSPPLKEAYETFREIIDILKKTEDKEIKSYRKLIGGYLRNLLIHCYSVGPYPELYNGKNPCENSRDKISHALSKISNRKFRRNSELVDAVKSMAKICDNCPYK